MLILIICFPLHAYFFFLLVLCYRDSKYNKTSCGLMLMHSLVPPSPSFTTIQWDREDSRKGEKEKTCG